MQNRSNSLGKLRESLRIRGLPRTIISAFTEIFAPRLLPDSLLGSEFFAKIRFVALTGYFPDIDNPTKSNEKIQHRKFRRYDTRYSEISDKHAVRSLVAEKIGEEILTDVYHITDDPESIPFDSLPDRYVVKPNHMSGQILFVDSNDNVDVEEIKRQCVQWLEATYGQSKGEYWYADIPPKILVEENLNRNSHNLLKDYKFYVFHGRVEYIQVNSNRFTNLEQRFYDRDWKPYDFVRVYPLASPIDKPCNLARMIDVAETLAGEFDFMRVDLYQLEDGLIKFGELTPAPGSGIEPFKPPQVNVIFGEYWNLDV